MPINVVTVNVNGVRAAFRKGMADWLADSGADVIALQEVRASDADLDELFTANPPQDGGQWHILHAPVLR
jgi:exodeoxyribonuclease-3